MATTSRYTLLGAGANFMDFYLPFADVSLDGQTIIFKGSAGLDDVYVGAAAGLTFDFTGSGIGNDKIYLAGAWSDYSLANPGTGNVLTLTRISGGSEVIKVNSGDSLIFANGAVSVSSALAYAAAPSPATLPVLDPQVVSGDFPVPVTAPLSNTVRAVVQDSTGETIAGTRPGVALIVKGNNGVDIVYVNAGTSVDATALSGGVDKIYLTGNLSDYSGSVAGSVLTLSRTVNGHTEIVKVLQGNSNTATSYDLVVFSDGSQKSYDLFSHFSSSNTPLPPSGIDVTPQYNPTVFISADVPSMNATHGAHLTFTLSKAATDFTAADITVTGGTLSNFAGSGTTYTATLTPDLSSTTAAKVSVGGGLFSDSAGKLNNASGIFSLPVDTVIATPTIALLHDTGSGPADRITNDASLSLSDPASDVTRTYTVDGAAASPTYVAPTTDGSHTIVVTDTDAFGNVAQNSLTFILESSLPAVQAQAAHSTAEIQTIELTYTVNLDEGKIPGVSAFTVTTGGAPNAVSAVSITGSVVTLTLADPFSKGMVSVTYTAPTANGSTPLQDIAGNHANSFTSGMVADGYVRGATVYVDSNHNGLVDVGTDFLVGQTDANGNFFLPTDAPPGTIIATGGVNTDTGVANTLQLKAPEGSTTINPLTTLVQAVIDASAIPITANEASQTIATSLGLNLTAGQSLTSYDPIASGDLVAQKAAAQVATIVSMASNGDAATGATVMSNIANEIQNTAPSTTVDLTDTTVLTNALQGVTTSIELQSSITNASSAIQTATDINAVSAVQSQYLDTVAANAPTLSLSTTGLTTALVTKNPVPSLRVSIDVTDTSGHANVAGDTIVVRDGAVQVASYVVQPFDIGRGFIDVILSSLADGLHSLTAVAIDQAGNASVQSSAVAVTVDTAAPNAPVIKVIAGDDILGASEQSAVISGIAEANSTLTLSLGTANHVVAVQLDGSWSYTLTPADITALGQGGVVVSAATADEAGNKSVEGTRALSVDTFSPTAVTTVVGANTTLVSGDSTNDNTPTLQGQLQTAPGGNEFVQVFVDGVAAGIAQVLGSSWSYTTSSLSNATHTFTAAVQDLAGNKGAVSADFTLTVNASVPTATVSFNGTGSLTKDALSAVTGSTSGLLDVGDKVVVYEGPNRLGSATVNGSAWTFTPANALSDGTHIFTAVVEGSGGNQGAVSATYALAVDTLAPALPSIQVVAGDDVINALETASVISGTAEGSASVSIDVGGQISQVTAAANGTWSHALNAADLTALGQGQTNIIVTATDAAGNASVAAVRMVKVDTGVPDAPVIAAIAGDSKINNTEMVSGFAVSGTAEALARVDLNLGSGNVRSVFADASGNWSYNMTTSDVLSVGQGIRSFGAKATDAAGNTGSAATQSLLIDTIGPVLSPVTLAPDSDTGVVGDGRGSAVSPTVQFTGEAGASVQLSVDGGAYQAAQTATGGLQTLASTTPLSGDGVHTLSVKETDLAGNTSLRNATYTLDTSAPTQVSATVNGTGLAITFTEALDASKLAASGAFAVAVGGVAREVTAVAVNGSTVNLTLASAVYSTDTTVSLTYTDPSANNDPLAVQDLAGNDAATFSVASVTNNSSANPAPLVQSGTVAGKQLILTFDKALDAAHQLDLVNINVTVNGGGRGVTQASVNGNMMILLLGAEVIAGDSVAVSYRDVTSGNDLFGIQDSAGNDAASFADFAVTNSSTGMTGEASIVGASFTESGGASTVTVHFNHPMLLGGQTLPFQLLKLNSDGTTTGIGVNSFTPTLNSIGQPGASKDVTFFTNTPLTAVDTVLVRYIDGNTSWMEDASYVWTENNTVVIGGSAAGKIDLGAYNLPVYAVSFYGNGGDDEILNSQDQVYRMFGGPGADTMVSGWGQNVFRLGDGNTPATDTVKVNVWNSDLTSHDRVYGFDTSNAGGTNNDVLGLPSGVIAANTAGVVDGADVAIGSTAVSIRSHSITAGIVSFSSANDGSAPLMINAGNLKAALQYLAPNLAIGETAAFNYDADGSGYADTLYVFQKAEDYDVTSGDIVVALNGVMGATLGTTAGQGVVQIKDVFGVTQDYASPTPNGFVLHTNEVIASVDFTGGVLKHGRTSGGVQSITTMANPIAVVGVDPSTVSVSTDDATIVNGDFILVEHGASAGALVDAANISTPLFDLARSGSAIGTFGAQIDLSGLAGFYGIAAFEGGDTVLTASQGGSRINAGGGNDTLNGSSVSDRLRAGAGSDILNGNAGNDVLIGGKGADTLDGGAGSDQYAFNSGDSPVVTFNPVSAINGLADGDTFSFAGGKADVVSGAGFDVYGRNGDRITFWTDGANLRNDHPMTLPNSQTPFIPTNGLVADEGYFMLRGDYVNGSFTVNQSSGVDSLVVYDGDQNPGSVAQSGLVIQGLAPSEFTQDWSNIYRSNLDFASSVVNGNNLRLQYNKVLDAAHQPDLANFVVQVNGLVRSVNQLAIEGNTVVLKLSANVAQGDTVTVTYRDVNAGDDAYAIQSTSGADAASLNSVAVTNNTFFASQPNLVAVSFTETTNSTVSLTFNQPMVLGGASFTLYKMTSAGVSTQIGAFAPSVSGAAINIATTETLGATDSVIVTYGGAITNTSNMWANSGSVVIGGSGASTIDLKNFSGALNWPIAFYGNANSTANDALTSSDGKGYLLVGGSGTDTIISGWGQNIVRLDDNAQGYFTDILKVNMGQSGPNSNDQVFGFDTTNVNSLAGTTTNDVLALPSRVIAANTGVVNGADAAYGSAGLAVKSHSIASGVATFFGADDGTGGALKIDDGNLKAVVQYLDASVGIGQTVAINYDADGNGYTDTMYVFQNTGSRFPGDNDILVALRGVMGATLGNTPGQGVVQITDGFGPSINSALLTASGLVLQANEVVASTALTALNFEFVRNGVALPSMTVTSRGVSASDNTKVVFTTSAAVDPTDYVVVTHPTQAQAGQLTDAASPNPQTSYLFDGTNPNNPVGVAIGGVGNQTIDLTAKNGSYNIVALGGGNNTLTLSLGGQIESGAGHDTLNGSAFNDQLRGGGGNDILNAGTGDDQLNGGFGADTLNGGGGNDQFNINQGESPLVNIVRGSGNSGAITNGDIFSFAGGAGDVIASGFDVTGQGGDKINFQSSGFDIVNPHPMTNSTTGALMIPADGLVGDQQYFVLQGNYLNGAFTVNNLSGLDSLVVYDGDQSSGVTQTALVIKGVMPSQLVENWGQIYLNPSQIDSTPPLFSSASVIGGVLTMTFTESLDASNFGATTAFNVTVNGASRGVASMSVNGASVTLILSSAVATGETVTVGYSDPTAGNDFSAIQDAAGNDLATLSTQPVTNSTSAVDTTPPVFSGGSVTGSVVTLVYNESLDIAHQPNLANLGVSVNGAGRGINQVAVVGNTLVLNLGSDVAPNDVVTVSYRDIAGDDLYAIQDIAGNDALVIANGTLLTNKTTTVAFGSPTVAAVSFTEPGTGVSTVSMTFNHPVLATGNPLMSLVKVDQFGVATTMGVTGVAFTTNGGTAQTSGETVTFTTDTLLSATDTVVMSYTGGDNLNHVADSNGNWVMGGTTVVGGSLASAIDLSKYTIQNYPVVAFGNAGDDIFTNDSNTGNSIYRISAGSGADTINSGWAETIIRLGDSGTTRFTDTVNVDMGQSYQVSHDRVFGFDATQPVLNDVLGLPSDVIAANATNVNGVDVPINSVGLAIKSHSITSGIVTFASADDGTGPLLINASSAQLKAVVNYLTLNLKVGETVAFNCDGDSNGYVDTLYVFQKTDSFNINNDILVGLRGVMGATLGNTAGQNVVQIVDNLGPQITGPALIGNGIGLQVDEALASVDFVGATLQHGHTDGTGTQTLTPMGTVSVGAPGAGHPVAILNPTDHTQIVVTDGVTAMASGDFVLVSSNGLPGSMTDMAGHSSSLFDLSSAGAAIGGLNGTGSHIDLSALTGAYNIISLNSAPNSNTLVASQGGSWMNSGDGSDTLTGGAGNDVMRGGAGNDTLAGLGGNDRLVGGAGVDTLDGGANADQYVFNQGDSPVVTFAHSQANASASVVTTGDTFTFAAGADLIVNNGFQAGDTINFQVDGPNFTNPNPMNGGASIPANGLVADQQYFAVRGDFAGNIFTVNTASGADSLVVYDGDQSNAVLQTGLVIQGSAPSQLVQQWGQIYHV